MSAVLDFPQRHAIDVAEFLRMGAAGVFAPDARLELIEGEILEMAPIGSPHAGAVNALNALFGRKLAGKAMVAVQNPMVVGKRSLPQPDVVLLKPRDDFYAGAHPEPEDVLLVVEVADSSLSFDAGTKMPLYARAGIAEAWIVDVEARAVRVHREPSLKGYRSIATMSGRQRVAVAALPQIEFAADALFPSRR